MKNIIFTLALAVLGSSLASAQTISSTKQYSQNYRLQCLAFSEKSKITAVALSYGQLCFASHLNPEICEEGRFKTREHLSPVEFNVKIINGVVNYYSASIFYHPVSNGEQRKNITLTSTSEALDQIQITIPRYRGWVYDVSVFKSSSIDFTPGWFYGKISMKFNLPGYPESQDESALACRVQKIW